MYERARVADLTAKNTPALYTLQTDRRSRLLLGRVFCYLPLGRPIDNQICVLSIAVHLPS